MSSTTRRIRLENAMELLRDPSLTIYEVALKSGFHSVTYFTNCFKDHYGYPPGQSRRNAATVDDPVKSHNQGDKPGLHTGRSSRTWIIAALAAVVLATLLFLLFNPIAGNQISAEKSIAVLPFRDDSPTKDYTYIINGFMEEILHNLASIDEFGVVSRTSVEKYRDSDKSISEIGRELNVNYILEGSAQTIEGNTMISLQLIDAATDKHLWSRSYNVEITLGNFFEIQQEVSLAVANELEVVLASNEIERLEKIPTENIAAYNLYLMGKDFLNINLYSVDNNGREKALLDAKQCFEKAIELDSTFADAYTLLASKAAYYGTKGRTEEARRIYERLSKNGHLAYEVDVDRYYVIEDYYNAIGNYLESMDRL